MPARFLRPRSLALLEYMAQRAVRPDARATTAAMTALEARGEWVLALRLLARLGHAADRVAWTVGLSACAQGGAWVRALALLRTAPEPHVNTVNAVITSLRGHSGAWPHALRLLVEEGPAPRDAVTFNAAIAVCEAAEQWRTQPVNYFPRICDFRSGAHNPRFPRLGPAIPLL